MQTCNSIQPDRCKYSVKSNSVSVTLKKDSKAHWPQLFFKPNKFEGRTGGIKKEDGGSATDSLMDLMKDMYNEGDDQMKKTIAESFMKAREGQQETPKF